MTNVLGFSPKIPENCLPLAYLSFPTPRAESSIQILGGASAGNQGGLLRHLTPAASVTLSTPGSGTYGYTNTPSPNLIQNGYFDILIVTNVIIPAADGLRGYFYSETNLTGWTISKTTSSYIGAYSASNFLDGYLTRQNPYDASDPNRSIYWNGSTAYTGYPILSLGTESVPSIYNTNTNINQISSGVAPAFTVPHVSYGSQTPGSMPSLKQVVLVPYLDTLNFTINYNKYAGASLTSQIAVTAQVIAYNTTSPAPGDILASPGVVVLNLPGAGNSGIHDDSSSASVSGSISFGTLTNPVNQYVLLTLEFLQFRGAPDNPLSFSSMSLTSNKSLTFTPGASGGTQTVTSSGSSLVIYGLQSEIKVKGFYVDPAENWRIKLKDGLFQRRHTLSSQEPANSWLRQYYNPGDDLYLIYTVPEYNSQPGLSNQSHLLFNYREPAVLLDSHRVQVGNPLVLGVTEILVNNQTLPLSGLLNIDTGSGLLTLSVSLQAKDKIQVSYSYREDSYIYLGFADNNGYYDLDLNPNYGHYLSSSLDGLGAPSHTYLKDGVTLYALPTAAYKASDFASGNVVYRSAMDPGISMPPTSFIRHRYNAGYPGDDGTSLAGYPSSVILAKIYIDSPGTIGEAACQDIRIRGGGLPETIDKSAGAISQAYYMQVNAADAFWVPTKIDVKSGDYLSFALSGNAATASGSPSSFSQCLGLIASSGNVDLSRSLTFNLGVSGITALTSGRLFLRYQNYATDSGIFYVRINLTRKNLPGKIWDESSWDGDPVPLNGVSVIELPKELLTGENGYQKFTTEEIKGIIQKQIALGTYAVIRYV